MANMKLILLVFSLVLAVLAAAGIPAEGRRYNLLAAAFAFFIATLLFYK